MAKVRKMKGLSEKLSEKGMSDHDVTTVYIAIEELDAQKYKRWTKYANATIVVSLVVLALSFLKVL